MLFMPLTCWFSQTEGSLFVGRKQYVAFLVQKHQAFIYLYNMLWWSIWHDEDIQLERLVTEKERRNAQETNTHAKCVRVGNGCGGHTLNFMSWKRCTEMMSEVWEYRQRAKENNHTVVETPITGTKNCFLTIKQQLFFLFNNLCNFQNSWYCFANWNQDSIKAIT